MSAGRVLTIAAALAAAACFLVAVAGGRWWAIGEVGVGPVSTQRCFDGDCGPGGLAWTGGSDLWVRAGFATQVAGLIAGVVFIILAGARAEEKRAAEAVAASTPK